MHRRRSQVKSKKKAAVQDIAGKATVSPKNCALTVNQVDDLEWLPATVADFKAVMQAITTLTDKVDHIQANVEFIRKDFDTFHG